MYGTALLLNWFMNRIETKELERFYYQHKFPSAIIRLMNQNYSKPYRQIYFRIIYFHTKKQNPDITIARCFRRKAARKRHQQMSFLEINEPFKNQSLQIKSIEER